MPGKILGPCIQDTSKNNGQSLLLFSRSVVFNSLRPHGLQHARFPCPSLFPGVCSNSSPLSWRCHPTISSSVISFSSCLQPFPASGSFPSALKLLYTLSFIIISAPPQIIRHQIPEVRDPCLRRLKNVLTNYFDTCKFSTI